MTVHEMRNAGGVLLGWHESANIVRECADERETEFNIEVIVKEVEKTDEHEDFLHACPDRLLPR